MEQLIDLFKVLTDETRIRILNLLLEKDLCVCEFTELLDLSQPKVSKHIAKIRSLNLVTTKRNEQFIYYSLNKDNKELISLLSIIRGSNNKQLKDDLEAIKNKTSFVCTR